MTALVDDARGPLALAVAEGGLPTDDVLDRLLPLMRAVAAAHDEGRIADLDGLSGLEVDEWGHLVLSGPPSTPRSATDALRAVEGTVSSALQVVGRGRLDSDLSSGETAYDDHAVLADGAAVTFPVHVRGYRTWEGQLGHRDALVDVFVLGALLASLACGLDLTVEEDHRDFVGARGDLFRLAPDLHPVLARTAREMTELDRHRRTQDLHGIVRRLQTYRDQPDELDIAALEGFADGAPATRRELVLERLRDRLFDPSRRNRLLYFKPTQQTVDLTVASVPHLLDHRRVRAEDLLTWRPDVAATLAAGGTLKLSSALRFEDNPYLAGSLDRIISQGKRDRAEYGFAQLRLVVSFLRWHDLRGAATEVVDSPLLLLPVELTKKKGVRDTYGLTPSATEAEVNPSLRQRLADLYALRLPERVTVSAEAVADFHRELVAQVQASEPGVAVQLVEQPRVQLIQRQARLRAEAFARRRSAAAARARARAVTGHSYAREDYRPRGLQLFEERVRPAPLPQRVTAGGRADELRVPTAVATAPEQVLTRETYALETGRAHGNPYEWEIDLCRLTVGTFNYRRMTLVQDYERLLRSPDQPSSFDHVFGVEGRPLDDDDLPLPTSEQHLVVDSDQTQLRAVARARDGQSYIVQGPPGTGKSQTITNLIADHVARGKRVLFVCEKRAAVDVVYHRLRQAGLDALCCLIHDSQADKKAFVHDLRATYEAHLAAGEDVGTPAEDARAELVGEVDAELEALHRLSDALGSEVPGTAMPALELLDHLLTLHAATGAVPELDAEQRELLPTLTDWRTAASSARRLERAFADAQDSPRVCDHPVALLGPAVLGSDRPQRTAGLLLTRAQRQLAALQQVLDRSRLPVELVDDLPAMLALAEVTTQVLVPLREQSALALLDAESSRGRAFDRLAAEHAAKQRDAEQTARAADGWSPEPDLASAQEALAAARRSEGRPLAGLRPSWRRARRLVQEQYRPTDVPVSEALELLVAQRTAAAALSEVQLRAHDELGAQDVDELARLVEQGRRLRRSPVHAVASALARPSGAQLEVLIDELDVIAVELDDLGRSLGELLSDPGVVEGGLPECRTLLERLEGELDLLPAVLEPLRALGDAAPDAVRALTRLPLSADQLELASGQRALDGWLAQDRALARLDGTSVELRVDAVAMLRADLLAANAAVIRERIRRRFLENVRVTTLPAAQLDAAGKAFKKSYGAGRRELEHEFGKVMRYKSIRDIAGGPAGAVVADLKPVWLMSPLSVSDTLPLVTDAFDVVVFDEASQIPVEDAVPALHRAPQVVVVGDQMQLPPTSFFSARDDLEDELVVEEDGETIAVPLDSASFLNQSAGNLGSVLLAWHYRSRSEALIGFSNAAFYGGELRTVPDRAVHVQARPELVVEAEPDVARGVDAVLDRPISHHRLVHGVYEDRRNLAEAAYVAALVRELLSRETGRSIGIVAFSEAQQGVIEEALARLAAKDDAFAARLEAERDREEDDQYVGLFVKNLENVQGDERDIVVLSICYAPDPRGRMRMNFGPINAADGEKRLNVIFSRAKHHMVVVASIRNDAITNDWNDGARALKGFLRYAESSSRGDQSSAAAVLQAYLPRAGRAAEVRPAVLVEQLAAALRAAGCVVETDVGTSSLRCDVAVRLPDDDAHRLAVLVDHRRDAERSDQERYIDRPRAFSASGWETAHVLAKDWLADPDAVVDRLLGRLGRRTSRPVPAARRAALPRPVAPGRPAPSGVRRLELVADGSAKFWEISRQDHLLTVRFGRIGTKGQTQVKDLGTTEAAAARVERLVREKLTKGYAEVTATPE